MSDALRLFFALQPPTGVRRQLAALQSRLALEGRVVPADKLHITLAFLGQVSSERLETLRAVAHRTPLAGCELVLDRLGWFPRAGVAFARARRIPRALKVFHRALCRRLEEEDFELDRRRWQPHVTLYRDLRTPFERIGFEPIVWPLESFELVQSDTRPDGSRYQTIGEWSAAVSGDR